MTAMTAMTLSSLSEGRFILGLGSSGPQIVEGLHGQSFERPLSRMKETIEVIRAAFAGEKITVSGEQIQLPLPGGEGRPMRLAQPPNEEIPIYLATLGPKSLEYTARSRRVGSAPRSRQNARTRCLTLSGLSRIGKAREKPDRHPCRRGQRGFWRGFWSLVPPLKVSKAFTLAAMGSEKTNSITTPTRSQAGRKRPASQIWVKGHRDQAALSVPDEMVLQTNLLGTDEMVRERLRLYRKAGVTTLKVSPMGKNLEERITALGKVIDLACSSDQSDRPAKMP